MKGMTHLLLLLGALAHWDAALSQSDIDPFASGTSPDSHSTEAALLSEVDTIAPGEEFTVAIKLAHQPGWHSYFVNPGSVGMVLKPNWDLPEGFEVNRVGWPVPKISLTAGEKTFGYEGTVYHLFRVAPPENLAPGTTVTLKATPAWQICDEKNCIMEPPFNKEVTHEVELQTAAAAAVNPEHENAFQAARAMLPQPLPDDLSVRATRDTSGVTIHLAPASNVPEEEIYFFDYDRQLAAQDDPVIERGEEEVRWKIAWNPDDDAPRLDRLAGILKIGEQGYHVDPPFTTARRPGVAFGRLLAIFGGMFLGGMILNLMPCVFPVIGLKIMGFVQQAGEARGKIAMHGIVFTVGVVLSFWVLAGFLLGLREGLLGGAADREVSWGYQLQNPWMVWGLMLVMFLLALNMFGVFEIGASATGVGGNLARQQGMAGTFFSGVLATIVATPCSAPFLGAALGATFTLPRLTFMTSFTFMALGLAAPYLVLSIFPQLVQKLPKPGPWMESFKQAMSFLLFGTAGFLLSVYVQQIQLSAMLEVILGLAGLAVAAWIYGRWCTIARSKRTRITGALVAIAFAAFGVTQSKPPAKGLEWKEWSPETVRTALDEGRPVYVDFTAAWCATCQVNKKIAYTPKVRELFDTHNVLVLKADFTNRDPEIASAIEELGRAAVPVNVLYVPGDDSPHVTAELLTGPYMADFLQKHLPPSRG